MLFLKVSQIQKGVYIFIRILAGPTTYQYLNMLVAPFRASFLRSEVKKKYTSKTDLIYSWANSPVQSLPAPILCFVLCDGLEAVSRGSRDGFSVR